ncbi:uncharacterized protein H6S33_001867 [Morchella sextelata]|uniref:uncharacterized protein n=1 Tax=Morchella sextelata TaxID=1174677 RepID=UPI001D04D08E|nr:uncharacterized protein H6S33_001867 [Morchella sextelata]KAH0608733.1 hypothetical protein H6S33_001867 [Morchella sextelata]
MGPTNPFSRDPEAQRNVLAYKILTLLSFLLAFVTAIVYTHSPPLDGSYTNGTIFGISDLHVTPFTQSHVFVSIYWIVLYFLQIGYIWHLFSGNEAHVKAAASVGSHFILFNLLHFAWIMLWCRSHFILSEVVEVIQFLQLTALYLRHSTLPRWIHTPVVAMPLTFTFFLVVWNGAVMVHCHGLICRVLANVAIWGILVYAGFFLAAFKDWHIGFATAFLSAGLGVGQFFTKTIALQWPFAFAIMTIVFLATCTVAVPEVFGASEARGGGERAPLLQESA